LRQKNWERRDANPDDAKEFYQSHIIAFQNLGFFPLGSSSTPSDDFGRYRV
jgi:predicted ATPase